MAAIAKRAGVHVTTVSLALRNHPSLPASTRDRIKELAKEMGYSPDPALSSLIAYRSGARATRNRHVLAYLTHWPTQWGWKAAPAHAEFYTGAETKAAQLGYQLEHFWLGEPGLSHQRMSDILRARGITGLIIASHIQEADHALHLDWSRFSAVKIDHLPHEPELHFVTNDQRAIAQLAMRRVIAAGYRRIGLALFDAWDHDVDLAWSGGFLPEQQRLQPADRIPPHFFRKPGPDNQAPRAAFEEWFRHYQPEVLMGYGPHLLGRLAAMNVRVPTDLAFVDVLLGDTSGRIAGVRQNCLRVGELAVEILVGQMHQHIYGIPAFPTGTLVEGTWFDGDSLPPRQRPIALAAEASQAHEEKTGEVQLTEKS